MRQVIAALILWIALSPGDLGAQQVRVTDTSPIEAKLAAIDQDSRLVSQALIQNYSRRLDRLDRMCREPRDRIADFAVKGVEMLQTRKNVKMSIFRFLTAMDKSLPDGSESLNLSCAEIAASLVMMIDRP